MRMNENDVRRHERMSSEVKHGMHRCAHAIRLWSCDMRERGRIVDPAGGEPPAGSLDAALTDLESDLSYLDYLPESGIAPFRAELDGMDERLKRVIAALTGPAP